MITMNTSITSISAGQKEQGVTVIKDAARKGAEEAIGELATKGVINSENFQRVLELGDKVSVRVRAFMKELVAELAKNINDYVKLISESETITLKPTDGKETLAEAGDLFTGWLDPNFLKWGTYVSGSATKEMNVTVHEMIKDGTFAQIFGGMADDLNTLCLSQAQIIQFVKKHKKWLHTDSHATFFLFKVGDEFFVARVRFDDHRKLTVTLYRLSFSSLWNAKYCLRVVTPQLAPIPSAS